MIKTGRKKTCARIIGACRFESGEYSQISTSILWRTKTAYWSSKSIALKPKLIIADEPVSALDVSVQAQVLNFMQEIQDELDLTYLFISHDLGVIKHMCDHIGIMYRGRFVEEGTAETIFNDPQHIYTKRLVAAIPDIDPKNRKKQHQF